MLISPAQRTQSPIMTLQRNPDVTRAKLSAQGTTQPANFKDVEEGRFFCGFTANTNFLPGLWACYYLVTQSVIVLLQTLSSTSWTWLFASNLHVNSKDELTLFVVTRQREIHPKHTGTGNVSLPMDQVLNSYLHGCTFGFRLITAYN